MGLEFSDPRSVERYALRRCLRSLPQPARADRMPQWTIRTVH